MKVSFRQVKSDDVVKKLEYLEDNIPGAYLRYSLRNVPHLVVTVDGATFSVAYFRGEKFYRIFWPFLGKVQTRDDRQTPEEVIQYFVEVANEGVKSYRSSEG